MCKNIETPILTGDMMADFTGLGTNAIIVLFVMVGILGIVVGSFLNVCIYRIPKKAANSE